MGARQVCEALSGGLAQKVALEPKLERSQAGRKQGKCGGKVRYRADTQ